MISTCRVDGRDELAIIGERDSNRGPGLDVLHSTEHGVVASTVNVLENVHVTVASAGDHHVRGSVDAGDTFRVGEDERGLRGDVVHPGGRSGETDGPFFGDGHDGVAVALDAGDGCSVARQTHATWHGSRRDERPDDDELVAAAGNEELLLGAVLRVHEEVCAEHRSSVPVRGGRPQASDSEKRKGV